MLFRSTTVNIEPSAHELASIARLAATYVRELGYAPRIAMLSFSDFGSVAHWKSEKVREAVELVRLEDPELQIDGEMQADTAIIPKIIENNYGFSHLKGGANVLVFPDLASANIAYKLCAHLAHADAIGPVLMGLAKSAHVLRHGCEVEDIVNMTAIAVAET